MHIAVYFIDTIFITILLSVHLNFFITPIYINITLFVSSSRLPQTQHILILKWNHYSTHDIFSATNLTKLVSLVLVKGVK